MFNIIPNDILSGMKLSRIPGMQKQLRMSSRELISAGRFSRLSQLMQIKVVLLFSKCFNQDVTFTKTFIFIL